jgi:hypothetical protein
MEVEGGWCVGWYQPYTPRDHRGTTSSTRGKETCCRRDDLSPEDLRSSPPILLASFPSRVLQSGREGRKVAVVFPSIGFLSTFSRKKDRKPSLGKNRCYLHTLYIHTYNNFYVRKCETWCVMYHTIQYHFLSSFAPTRHFVVLKGYGFY